MAFERLRLLGVLMVLGGLSPAQGQSPGADGRIYSCVTSDGRRLTSDRPIAECQTREQTVHRKDGSVRGRLAPAMSPEEKAAADVKQRELDAQKAALADAARHDRNLLTRYRNQPVHDKAREAALDDIIKATEISERRLKDLARERKTLDDEAEFYKGRALPAKLKQQVDANDAAVEAQKLFIEQQEAERVRVNRRYDLELARLKKLWAGAAPGSLGPAPTARDFEAEPTGKPAAKAASQ
ncbi:hypothetical protein HNQ51_000050 [Inhella inkyongensis]|uniref:DUF4124 domain-containing protein n=1 Tax=Inhella inkyongensis TaxID=392593 RepID=A0A840RVS6_9BURK|nr:hypothetical protein [Inhella inkyongensis]MBB5202757.1 hypothetical protein [Inhella inkyongensis]